jgi:hypothetical protein
LFLWILCRPVSRSRMPSDRGRPQLV